MTDNEIDNMERKTYYVSVQAGQILEDQQAAAYELEIMMDEVEYAKLRELFDELSSMDEAEMFHFSSSPYGEASNERINSGYDELIQRIYKRLYELGTDNTKQHIASMGMF